MIKVSNPFRYSDEHGNVIECDNPIGECVSVIFRGGGNFLSMKGGVRRKSLTIMFDCNGARCEIGDNRFRGKIRLGEGCSVIVSDGVTCTGPCYISTAEGSSVAIGEDCMIASRNEIRSDDGHPIFAVDSGKRTNMPRSISIGNHVWLAAGATVLGGSCMGDGSIAGLGSVVKGRFPNNCVLAGVPARIVRRDVAWERPHLTLAEPYVKPDSTSVERSGYWRRTDGGVASRKRSIVGRLLSGLRSVFRTPGA